MALRIADSECLTLCGTFNISVASLSTAKSVFPENDFTKIGLSHLVGFLTASSHSSAIVQSIRSDHQIFRCTTTGSIADYSHHIICSVAASVDQMLYDLESSSMRSSRSSHT